MCVRVRASRRKSTSAAHWMGKTKNYTRRIKYRRRIMRVLLLLQVGYTYVLSL